MSEKHKKAVALKYEFGSSPPKIIAKGQGEIAERIISLARENGVPIYEEKSLVEALSTLDMYQDIPENMYSAVAEILSFVYKTLNLDRKSL